MKERNVSMKAMIYCVKKQGVHSFFMMFGRKEYYLFSQNYRKGVQNFYNRGVSLNESIDFSKAHNDSAVMRTMSKIPMYIKYIEKDYGIEVFEKTKKKNRCYSFSMNKCA